MSTLREILERHLIGDEGPQIDQLERDLTAREDEIADQLRLAGAQLGAMPEFVAKVIADVGLGTPPTPEQRQLLGHQFAVRMQWLAEEIRRMNGEQT